MVERAAAGSSLSDPAAISDYINSFLGGAVPGSVFGAAIGGHRQTRAAAPEITPSAPTAADQVQQTGIPPIPDNAGISPIPDNSPEAVHADLTAQHAAATEQVTALEPVVAQAKQEHDTLVARREALDAESKLDVGARRTKAEIVKEKRAVTAQIKEAKSTIERIGGELFAARQTTAELVPQVEASRAALEQQAAAPGPDAVPDLVVPDEGLNPAITPRTEPIVSDTIIDPNGPACGCGKKGCVEQYASASAVAKKYGKGSAKDCFDAAKKGNPEALAVLKAMIRRFVLDLVKQVEAREAVEAARVAVLADIDAGGLVT